MHQLRVVLGEVLGGCEKLRMATEARPSALGVSGVKVGRAVARMGGEGELESMLIAAPMPGVLSLGDVLL